MEVLKMKANEILAKTYVNNGGDWNKTHQSLANKHYSTDENDILGDFITILDKEYPDRLKSVYKPPFVLFYKGNLSLLENDKAIGVVADDLYNYSWSIIDKLLFKNKENRFIIGSNSEISKGFARSTQNIILVLNTSLDNADKELVDLIVNGGGLVITENPYGVKATVNDFTRVISGLENRQVVVSCKEQSLGILQLMNSLSMGHEIFVLPTPLGRKGYKNNQFISEGATLFYTAEQLA
jgi:DNA processing protein